MGGSAGLSLLSAMLHQAAAVCLLLSTSLSSSLAQEQSTLTPCQRCCAPGGDCSKAFKGTPGKCCGGKNGQAFCCPGVTDGPGSAKCYDCGDAFRCYTGFSPRAVCGPPPRLPTTRPRNYDIQHQSAVSADPMVVVLIFALFAYAIWVRRQRRPLTHASASAGSLASCETCTQGCTLLEYCIHYERTLSGIFLSCFSI